MIYSTYRYGRNKLDFDKLAEITAKLFKINVNSKKCLGN